MVTDMFVTSSEDVFVTDLSKMTELPVMFREFSHSLNSFHWFYRVCMQYILSNTILTIL